MSKKVTASVPTPTSGPPISFWDYTLSDAEGNFFAPGYTVYPPKSGWNAWDVIYLGSQQLPGIVEVSVRKLRDIDKKKAAGQNGATLTLHGFDPAEGDIKVTIWTPQQFIDLQTMLRAILIPSGKSQPDPLDVTHPKFQTAGVTSVVPVGIDSIDKGSVQGTMTLTLKVVEYIARSKTKAVKTVTKPIGSNLDPPAPALPGANHQGTGPQ